MLPNGGDDIAIGGNSITISSMNWSVVVARFHMLLLLSRLIELVNSGSSEGSDRVSGLPRLMTHRVFESPHRHESEPMIEYGISWRVARHRRMGT